MAYNSYRRVTWPPGPDELIPRYTPEGYINGTLELDRLVEFFEVDGKQIKTVEDYDKVYDWHFNEYKKKYPNGSEKVFITFIIDLLTELVGFIKKSDANELYMAYEGKTKVNYLYFISDFLPNKKLQGQPETDTKPYKSKDKAYGIALAIALWNKKMVYEEWLSEAERIKIVKQMGIDNKGQAAAKYATQIFPNNTGEFPKEKYLLEIQKTRSKDYKYAMKIYENWIKS